MHFSQQFQNTGFIFFDRKCITIFVHKCVDCLSIAISSWVMTRNVIQSHSSGLLVPIKEKPPFVSKARKLRSSPCEAPQAYYFHRRISFATV